MPEKELIKILCIEDDAVVADYISSLLDKNIYSINTISDGQKALDFLLTTSQPPDLLILDYILPSLDGIKVLQGLKAGGKEYAIIFLTGDSTLETAVAAMKEGALDYVTKSSNLKTILPIKIEKAFQQYQERIKKEYYEEQLALLSLAVEQSPNSIVITDVEGNIRYINEKFVQYTGYSFEEVKGKNPRILKAEGIPASNYKHLWQTITSGKPWQGEFINRKKNGDLFYEKAVISPIMNKAGKIVSYLGIKEDITELKKAEDALNARNREMENFFEVVSDLLSISDNTGKFKRLNKAWEDLLGYTSDELMKMQYMDLIHLEDLESTANAVREMIESGRMSNFVNRYRCKDGSYKFMEWNSRLTEDGSSYSSARDITGRKLSEQALKESEARFRSIFETANTGIAIIGKNDYILMVNKFFLTMMGYDRKEISSIPFVQFTHPDDLLETEQLHQNLITNESSLYRVEKRFISKSGKIIWVDLAVAPIRNDSGKLIYFIGVINDISERKDYEQQLENINATKDKFFSIIAHDLRNQFSGIQGLSEILMIRKNLTEGDKEKYISLLHHSGKSALNLLENLLEWSRSQLKRVEMIPEKINLYTLTKEVLSLAKNQAMLKQIELESQVQKSQVVYADQHMLHTVLRNLISNAIKFTPSQGKVVISACTLGSKQLISIKDNGVGIAPDRVSKLFLMDSERTITQGTGKEKGTGLGLLLCKEFIDKHNGEIKVTSEENIGTEFVISLPVSPK
jgi:PAS domain S-box-containing protein